ncbi:MAG: hypothetical protein J6K19_09765 [Prevotella sp.]|nr:hypothetical protein [Prevotella sp.]
MENRFDFKKIGPGYLFCFNAECPKREECIHFAVSRHIPDSMSVGQAVLPSACRSKECKYFKLMQTVEYAYGFEHIYDKVLSRDYTDMRKQLTAYLGNRGKYYVYKHGRRGLSPEQQRYISQTFARYGYTDPVVFDRYETQYDY